MPLNEKGLEKAAREYLLHRGEQPSRITKRGAELWEDYEAPIAAAITAYLQHAGEAEPVAWLLTHPEHGEVLSQHPITDGDRSLGWADTPLFAAPHPHQAPEGWQPIETAPKDGTLVLLYNVAHGEQAVMGWTNDLGMPDSFPEGCWTDAGGLNRAINLTVNGGYYQFWQPLPAPPAFSPNKEDEDAA